MTSNDIVTSKISTRSKVALATLISVSVLGSVYYNKYYHKKDKKDKLDSKDKLIDDNSLYNDFVASLPEATMLIDNTPDNLLNKLFTSSFYTEYMPSTFEELKTKMSSLYPAFEHQLEVIRDMYKSFWEFLSLEEFKAIVQESLKEDDDPELHPEIEWEAHVREGQELSREETEFVKRRKQKMRAAFAFFIGVDEHEVEIEDIPNIGIASSGGGYRAMVSCSGYLRAMAETGILDSVLYFCGVSGSTWTMCQLYSPLTDASLDTLQDHLSSRIHTHIANLSNFLTVLNASRHNAKVILHGIIQRYHQQNNSISLVDIFGMLLGGTLLAKKITLAPPNEDKSINDTYSEFIETDTQEEDGENHVHSGTMHEPDGARVKPRLLKKNEIKLSKQREYFEDGSLPMPIYCAVRHEIQKAGENKANTISSKTEEETEENKEDSQEHQEPKEEGEEGEVEEKEDLYQWFEFTPYDMGSEEINAWIPIWAFGRKFAEGKSDQRLPEQSIGILMGMFGSAFVASLAHFYQEIRSLLPQTAVEKADEIIYKYQSSVSTIHPISPACFPNPFYKMSTKVQDKDELNDKEEILRSESLVESEQIGLMDAGMDNNIPFYPLLRKGRDIDMIIAVDSSADIQYMPYFDRAEGYVKRRGIQGWPRGAGWPKKEEEKNNNVSNPVKVDHHKTKTSSNREQEGSEKVKSKYALGTCTVFESSSSETTPDKNDTASTTTTYPENTNPITLVYFPLIVNEDYDPDFDPQQAEFTSTWNFSYTREQVDKLHGLAEANVKSNLEKVRQVIRKIWERKRRERLARQNH